MPATASGLEEAGLRDSARNSNSTPSLGSDASPDDLLDLDAALSRLEREDPRAASVVKLRVFAGLTQDEAATASGGGPTDRRPRLGVRPRLALSAAFGESMSHGEARRSMTLRRPFSGRRSRVVPSSIPRSRRP